MAMGAISFPRLATPLLRTAGHHALFALYAIQPDFDADYYFSLAIRYCASLMAMMAGLHYASDTSALPGYADG